MQGELKISNLIVIVGIITLMILNQITWYFGLLIIIYLLDIKYNFKNPIM